MNKTIENIVMAFFTKYAYIKYVIACLAIFAISAMTISYSSFIDKKIVSKQEFFRPVIDKLLNAGVDSAFIYNLLDNPNVKFDEKFVKINVTGYLNKADYTKFYDRNSIATTRAFISENYQILNDAEEKYGVPKEVIASILWIETRHGKFLGKSNIVSVFFSTAMCAEQEFINLNIKHIRENSEISTDQYSELDKKVVARANKKSKWAINEIIALSKMKIVSPIPIDNIVGSWAGAFGMSQFLPSSYISWAVDGNSDCKVNLFDKEDAIFSVANYLKSNGWNRDQESKQKAVFHYNNSRDYVNAVLTLAEKSKYQVISKPLQEQIEDLDYHGE